MKFLLVLVALSGSAETGHYIETRVLATFGTLKACQRLSDTWQVGDDSAISIGCVERRESEL